MNDTHTQETYNEQKVVSEWEREFIKRAFPFLESIGCRRLHKKDYKRDGNEVKLPHRYFLGWKKHASSKDHRTVIEFQAIDYTKGTDEEDTPIVYDLPADGRNWSRKYDLRAAGVKLEEDIDEEIELHEEKWTAYSMNASFSITNKTKIEANAGLEIGPAKAGASASNETEISASSSFAEDGGEKYLRSYIHRIKTRITEIPVGKTLLVSCDIFKRRVITPTIENGFIETKIYLDIDDWAKEKEHYLRHSKDEKHNRIHNDTIQDLLWFIEGQRVVEYPRMVNFLSDMRKRAEKGNRTAQGAVDFYEWLKVENNRRVRLAKNKVRVYEFAGEVKTTFV